jgi:L-aspartate oxidase
VRSRFPNINGHLLKLEIDMTKEPVPVVPAAHYVCGGVAVDLEGRTELPGLYAIGEVAHTGMHGANRLASNSLLEAVVFSERAARSAVDVFDNGVAVSPGAAGTEWSGREAGAVPEGVLIDLSAIRAEIADYFARYPVSRDLLELRNISLVGELIIESARLRRESRGLHWMEDFPERDDEHFLRDTVLDGSSQS